MRKNKRFMAGAVICSLGALFSTVAWAHGETNQDQCFVDIQVSSPADRQVFPPGYTGTISVTGTVSIHVNNLYIPPAGQLFGGGKCGSGFISEGQPFFGEPGTVAGGPFSGKAQRLYAQPGNLEVGWIQFQPAFIPETSFGGSMSGHYNMSIKDLPANTYHIGFAPGLGDRKPIDFMITIGTGPSASGGSSSPSTGASAADAAAAAALAQKKKAAVMQVINTVILK